MDLKGRHFLTLKDYTPEEITYLLDLAADLKDKKKKGVLGDSLPAGPVGRAEGEEEKRCSRGYAEGEECGPDL